MRKMQGKLGGHPAGKRMDKQKKVVSMKLVELQYYAVRKRVGEAGLHISERIRRTIVSAEVISRLNKQDADAIHKLAGEVDSINRLAHRANTGGFALVAVELLELGDGIVETINRSSDDWRNKKRKRFQGLCELCAGQGAGSFASCGRSFD